MLYNIALFLHIIGALLLSSAVAVEWLCVINIQKAETLENLSEWIPRIGKLNRVYPTGFVLILIPGIYMSVIVWKDAGWVIIGLLGLVLLGMIGGIITGRNINKINKTISSENILSEELLARLNLKPLRTSIMLRTSVFTGIVLLMTLKPDIVVSTIIILSAVVIGLVPGMLKPEIKRAGNIEV